MTKPAFRKQKHHRSLTEEEREHFLKVGYTDRRYYLFLLMLLCGCRPGEAADVKGKDLTAHGDMFLLHIRGTKTDLAERTVPIAPELYEVIKHTPKEGYVACTASGHKIDPDQRRRIWKSYCRAINISMGCRMYRNALVPPFPLAQDLTPYNLRVEYCTNLARLGVDIRIAQKLMGHSTIALTANVYTNFQPEYLKFVSEAMGAAPGAASKG